MLRVHVREDQGFRFFRVRRASRARSDRRSGPQVALRVIEGQRMEWVVVDADAGKPVHTVGMQGVGVYGIYGGISVRQQGPNLVLMNPEQIQAGVPEKK